MFGRKKIIAFCRNTFERPTASSSLKRRRNLITLRWHQTMNCDSQKTEQIRFCCVYFLFRPQNWQLRRTRRTRCKILARRLLRKKMPRKETSSQICRKASQETMKKKITLSWKHRDRNYTINRECIHSLAPAFTRIRAEHASRPNFLNILMFSLVSWCLAGM